MRSIYAECSVETYKQKIANRTRFFCRVLFDVGVFLMNNWKNPRKNNLHTKVFHAGRNERDEFKVEFHSYAQTELLGYVHTRGIRGTEFC